MLQYDNLKCAEYKLKWRHFRESFTGLYWAISPERYQAINYVKNALLFRFSNFSSFRYFVVYGNFCNHLILTELCWRSCICFGFYINLKTFLRNCSSRIPFSNFLGNPYLMKYYKKPTILLQQFYKKGKSQD